MREIKELWDNVDVGAGVTLASTRVNPHKSVPEGANVEGSFLE
jgi:hypothetical protein